MVVLWSILKGSSLVQGQRVLPLHMGGVRLEKQKGKAHGELFSRKATPLQLKKSHSMHVWRPGEQEHIMHCSHVCNLFPRHLALAPIETGDQLRGTSTMSL